MGNICCRREAYSPNGEEVVENGRCGGGAKGQPLQSHQTMSAAYHSAGDDCAINELLEGRMELDVVLPDGRKVRLTVERRTPMMDLLVQAASATKISPAGHVIHVFGGERGALQYKPSTPVGSLDTNTICIVPKKEPGEPPLRKTQHRPSGRPFEPTFRVQVHLPRNQLTVARVSPRVKISELRTMVCREKGLDTDRYQLARPSDLTHALDGQMTLAEYGSTELTLLSNSCIESHICNSTSHIIPYSKRIEEKKKTGILRLLAEDISHAKTKGTAPPQPATASQPAAPNRYKPKKRRPAPPPPPRESATAFHSRQSSSDSSGYHETTSSFLHSEEEAGPPPPQHSPEKAGSDSSGVSSLAGAAPPEVVPAPPPFAGRKRRAPQPPLPGEEEEGPCEEIEEDVDNVNGVGESCEDRSSTSYSVPDPALPPEGPSEPEPEPVTKSTDLETVDDIRETSSCGDSAAGNPISSGAIGVKLPDNADEVQCSPAVTRAALAALNARIEQDVTKQEIASSIEAAFCSLDRHTRRTDSARDRRTNAERPSLLAIKQRRGPSEDNPKNSSVAPTVGEEVKTTLRESTTAAVVGAPKVKTLQESTTAPVVAASKVKTLQESTTAPVVGAPKLKTLQESTTAPVVGAAKVKTLQEAVSVEEVKKPCVQVQAWEDGVSAAVAKAFVGQTPVVKGNVPLVRAKASTPLLEGKVNIVSAKSPNLLIPLSENKVSNVAIKVSSPQIPIVKTKASVESKKSLNTEISKELVAQQQRTFVGENAPVVSAKITKAEISLVEDKLPVALKKEQPHIQLVQKKAPAVISETLNHQIHLFEKKVSLASEKTHVARVTEVKEKLNSSSERPTICHLPVDETKSSVTTAETSVSKCPPDAFSQTLKRSSSLLNLAASNKLPSQPKAVTPSKNLQRSLSQLNKEENRQQEFEVEQDRLHREYVKLQQQFVLWQNQLINNHAMLREERIVPQYARTYRQSQSLPEGVVPEERPSSLPIAQDSTTKSPLVSRSYSYEPTNDRSCTLPRSAINIPSLEIGSVQMNGSSTLRSSKTKSYFKPPQVRMSTMSRQRLPPEIRKESEVALDVCDDMKMLSTILPSFETLKLITEVKENHFGDTESAPRLKPSLTLLEDEKKSNLRNFQDSIRASRSKLSSTISRKQLDVPDQNSIKSSVVGTNVTDLSPTERNKVLLNGHVHQSQEQVKNPVELGGCSVPPPPPPLPNSGVPNGSVVPVVPRKPLGTKNCTTSKTKVPAVDHREQLMMEIRKCGGRTSLRKISLGLSS